MFTIQTKVTFFCSKSRKNLHSLQICSSGREKLFAAEVHRRCAARERLRYVQMLPREPQTSKLPASNTEAPSESCQLKPGAEPRLSANQCFIINVKENCGKRKQPGSEIWTLCRSRTGETSCVQHWGISFMVTKLVKLTLTAYSWLKGVIYRSQQLCKAHLCIFTVTTTTI